MDKNLQDIYVQILSKVKGHVKAILSKSSI